MTGSLFAQSVELVSRVHTSQVSDTGMGATTAGLGFEPQFFATSSISDDGRYAVFLSSATNLVPGQQENSANSQDVFLRDLLTGTTTLVSHSMSSPLRAGNDDSTEAVISGDGRYVAFSSRATDLAPGQPHILFDVGNPDLLLYDRITGTNTLIASHPFGPVGSAAISADGRFVAFTSNDPDLVPGQQGFPLYNVFLYDREDGSFRLASHISTSATTTGDQGAGSPSISADGRFVAFISSSSDLLPVQPPGPNIFLYDRTSGAVTLAGQGSEVVMSANGRYLAVRSSQNVYLYDRETQTKTVLSTQFSAGDSSRSLAISDDGRFIAYLDGSQALYLYDRGAGSHILASRRHGSPTVSGRASLPALSGNGRYAAFVSTDPDLVTGQTDVGRSWDLFLFDRDTGKTSLVSHVHSSASTAGNGPSSAAAISANGSRVVFSSLASDLVADARDVNEDLDVFTFETASASTVLASRRAPEMPSLTSRAGVGGGEARGPFGAVSGDGRWVVFESSAPHLIAGQVDTNQETDIFLYDRASRTTILVSHASGSLTRAANGSSVLPVLSADGRWIVFSSNAPDLVPGTVQSGSSYDLFLFDRFSGTTSLLALTHIGSFFGPHAYPWVRMSLDGRWITFTSNNPGIVPGQQDPESPLDADVFLWDRTTGSTVLVSRSTAGPTRPGNSSSLGSKISDDGRYVAFISEATDLVPGLIDTNDSPDLFLFDRMTGLITLVSHTLDSTMTAASIDPFEVDGSYSMSADGRFIVFGNTDGGVEPGVDHGGLYLYDRTTGNIERIAPYGNGSSAKISSDGRYVAFIDFQEVIPGLPPGNGSQLYLYDRTSKTTALVTRSILESRGGNDDTYDFALSADGRYLAFATNATDLIPGLLPEPGIFQPPARGRIFLFDRTTGTLTLVSRPIPSSIFEGGSGSPTLSASGRQVAFVSSEELIAGDLNATSDAYVFSLDPPPPPPPTGPIPLPTCKLIDTRRRAERPVLTSNVQRTVTAHGRCGVPATAKQAVVNVTVFNPSGKGNLRFYPGAVTATPSGILRFERSATRTETFTLPLSTNGTLTVLPFVANRGTVHMAVEVTGYVN